MEEDLYSPSEINSVDVTNVLHAGILYMNKKRKFLAEELDLPMSKHNSWDRGFASEFGSTSDETRGRQNFCTILIKGKIHGEEGVGESELDSGNGSNSFAGDIDSMMSECGEVKSDVQLWKTFSVNEPSTASVNWGSDGDKVSLYSLDSRSLTKSDADKNKSSLKDGGHIAPHHDIGALASLNYEQLLEYESIIHYDYGEDDSISQDFQNVLCAGSENPKNFVLSSGRWDVNQEEMQPATEKLTIDKEFEQYFSTLML